MGGLNTRRGGFFASEHGRTRPKKNKGRMRACRCGRAFADTHKRICCGCGDAAAKCTCYPIDQTQSERR